MSLLLPGDPDFDTRPASATIRPTVGRRFGDKVLHYEAQCLLCLAECEPDSRSNVEEWVVSHLAGHGVHVEEVRTTRLGMETWVAK